MAIAQTTVGVDVVGVVACFLTLTQDPVTAAGFDAAVGAPVAVVTVAVIAGFALIDSAVTADLSLAVLSATIARLIVAVVAALVALIA